jgi:hypothetical protein
MEANSQDLTALLGRLNESDTNLAEQIYPIVYNHLRQEAHLQLRGERAGHTLQTTALVHEAYLNMVGQEDASYHNRSHFMAIAALAMRRILKSATQGNITQRSEEERNRRLHLWMAWHRTKLSCLKC